uniref:Putative KilA-N domain-containing protein n=1 Tax=Anoplophora glabripennis TaxID=217634 RepID=V5GSQ5_ANOGL
MKSLRDACPEQIQDQHWHGPHGDSKIIIDKDTGYFNATKLCQDGGKEFKYWLRNKRSKELMRYYVSESARGEKYPSSYYIHGNQYDIISGTYLHPTMLGEVIQWIWLSRTEENGGYVYIATTMKYGARNVYKVGYTKDPEQRLKEFNNYRANFDLFFYVDLTRVSSAKESETAVHQTLESYRVEKELNWIC